MNKALVNTLLIIYIPHRARSNSVDLKPKKALALLAPSAHVRALSLPRSRSLSHDVRTRRRP